MSNDLHNNSDKNHDQKANPDQSSKSEAKSASSLLYDVQDWYEHFNLRKNIESTRETVNSKLTNNFVVQNAVKLRNFSSHWKDNTHQQILQCSNTLNEKYPYFSSIARTQEGLFILSATVLVAIPASRFRRLFLPLTGLTAMSAKATSWTFNYKFTQTPTTDPATTAAASSNEFTLREDEKP